jgi:Regulator of chromosome condensation (RCC1) repeat
VSTRVLVCSVSRPCLKKCWLVWRQRLFFITAGTHHAAVLDKLGNLYVWGTNGAGRLGVGHRGACATPTCVESLESIAIRHVSLGRNHSAAISAGGEGIYMWGCAAEGERIGLTNAGHHDVHCVHSWGVSGQLGMLVEGQVWAEMTNGTFRQSVCLVLGFGKVLWLCPELGFRVDVKVDQDGEVYCPVPTKLIIPKAERIRTVACGYNHTACVTVDGRLFVWG